MPSAHVQSRGSDAGSATSANLAYSSNEAAGSLNVVAIRVGVSGRTVTVTDNNGGSYSQAVNRVQTTDGHELFLFYAPNVNSGGCTVTVSISGAATTIRFTISEYSGVATSSPLDKTASAQGGSGTSDSGATATTTQAAELVIGATALGAGAALTAGTGYTLRTTAASPNKIGIEDKNVSSTGTYNATMTFSSDNWSCAVATFKDSIPLSPPMATNPMTTLLTM
jgi:hypothetical protein